MGELGIPAVLPRSSTTEAAQQRRPTNPGPEFHAPASWSAVTSGANHRFGADIFHPYEPNRQRSNQSKNVNVAGSVAALQDLVERSTVKSCVTLWSLHALIR